VPKPVNADTGFYALWADGHGFDKPAPCRLYFCNKAGDVRALPQTMDDPFARPVPLNRRGEK
jgi:hypothetical protein